MLKIKSTEGRLHSERMMQIHQPNGGYSYSKKFLSDRSVHKGTIVACYSGTPNRSFSRVNLSNCRALIRLLPLVLTSDYLRIAGSQFAGGATFTTSSSVVTPAATFNAPEIRNGFIPSRLACSRRAATSVLSVMSLRSSGVISSSS